METHPTISILVVGLSAAGAESLPSPLRQRIAAADLLVGGARHLGYFPAGEQERLAITADIDAIVARLRRALELGERAVVLASGDPLCYGIGATLRRFLPAEALEIVPAPTAFQLAFAALAEPWHDAALLSAHARPLQDVVRGVLAASKAAILTDNQHTPAAIARALLGAGLSGDMRCAVCENLGGPEQRIIQTDLARAAEATYAALNVFVVWRKEAQSPVSDLLSLRPPGLPDEAFSTSAGQITKREVRLLSLAELALGPGEVLWDIGAGSGSVAIEAARPAHRASWPSSAARLWPSICARTCGASCAQPGAGQGHCAGCLPRLARPAGYFYRRQRWALGRDRRAGATAPADRRAAGGQSGHARSSARAARPTARCPRNPGADQPGRADPGHAASGCAEPGVYCQAGRRLGRLRWGD